MKKKTLLVIMVLILGIIAFGLIYAIVTTYTSDENIATENETVFEYIKEREDKTPIWVDPRAIHRSDSLTKSVEKTFESMQKLDMGFLDRYFAHTDLLPYYITDNELLFCNGYGIEVFSLKKNALIHEYRPVPMRLTENSITGYGYGHEPKGWIYSITMPQYEGDTISFYIIVEGNDGKPDQNIHGLRRTENVLVKKVVLSKDSFVVTEGFELQIPSNLKLFYGNSNVNFFLYIAEEETFYVVLESIEANLNYDQPSYIAKFSNNGEFLGVFSSGSSLVPNSPNHSDIYYFMPLEYLDADLKKLQSKYALMKNYEVQAIIDKPVIDGYFINDNEIYVRCFDGNDYNVFYFSYGNWQLTFESYIVNTDNYEFQPVFLQYKWQEGNLLTRGFIENEEYLYIPPRDIGER